MRSKQCIWHQRITMARRVLRDLTALVVDLTCLVSALTLLFAKVRILVLSFLAVVVAIYLCMHVLR